MSFFLTSASTVDKEIGLVLINNGYLEFAIYRKGVPTKITGQQIFNSLIEYLKLKKLISKELEDYGIKVVTT